MAAIAQNNAMAGVQKCNAIKNKGDQCTRDSVAHGYCGMHENSRKTHGPLTFLLMQQGYKKKVEMEKLKTNYMAVRPLDPLKHRQDRLLINARYVEEERAIKARFEAGPEEDKELERNAEQRRRDKEERKRLDAERRREDMMADINRHRQQQEDERLAQQIDAEERVAVRLALIMAGGVAAPRVHEWAGGEGVVFAPAEPVAPAPAPIERGIGDIARDNQSIHTTEVVRHTKEIVEKVRSIPVPEGYRWDKEVCSKTPGEIIAECRLTQKAAWQMMAQYAQDTAIYDIEEGIYGKVLDSVWQFVKNHAEKESLTAILRTEMTDNIGMCAQGNLTRICNIVSGYMDGVGVHETLSEKLGRLLPPLRDIASRDERHVRVLDILRGNDVPFDDWDTWIDAVMED